MLSRLSVQMFLNRFNNFAFQVARNKIIGLSKILREVLEFQHSSGDEGRQLYDSLSKMAESSSFSLSEELLVENIKKYRGLRDDFVSNLRSTKMMYILRKQHLDENTPSI